MRHIFLIVAVVAAPTVLVARAPAAELFNNGTFVTGTSPLGNTISQLEDGYDTFGLVAAGYAAAPQRVADNFNIAAGQWELDSLTLYGYQTGGATLPFSSAYVAVYDFDPTLSDDLAPRYGSLDPASAPNALLSQEELFVFRVGPANLDDASRHVHSVTLDLSALPALPPGEYWFAAGLRGVGETSVVAVVPVAPTPADADALSYGRIRHPVPGRENFWQYADGLIPTGGDPNQVEPYEHAFKLDGTAGATNEWAGPGGGTYDLSTSNWTGGSIPGGADAVASFLGNITSDATVTLASPVTLGKINFNDDDRYVLTGSGGTITLDGTAGAQINVFGGQHAIEAPIVVNANLALNVRPADGELAIAGALDGPGRLVKRGDGLATVGAARTSTLEIRAGTLRVAPDGTSAATSRVERLGIDVGNAPRGRLDLSDNALVVDYTAGEAEPFDTIRALIVGAYNAAAWDGNGITSSMANATNFGIGYAEASELAAIPPIFGTVDGTAVLVRFTRYGDANLDGVVNLSDFNALAANFGLASGALWRQGDFTYDGLVNLSDFNRLAANFGLSAAGPEVAPADWAALAAAVPEPGMLGLIGFAALPLVRRRWRPQT